MLWAQQDKKLVLVLAIFTLVTGISKNAQKIRVLDKIPCICYSLQFEKDKSKDILALLDFGGKVNEMTLVYTA